MDRDNESNPSQLFLVRLWLADETDEEYRCYGKVQHVATGKAATFNNQTTKMQVFTSMFSSPGAENIKTRKLTDTTEGFDPSPNKEPI
jgi:hypothetical protein